MEKLENATEEKIGYRQILTQKEYCKLIAANLINRFGDSVDAVAFTWLVYQVTGSASWSAIIFALNMLPTILLQPFAGAVVERRNKKKLMIVTDALRGILVVALAVSYLTNVVNPWIMAVFTLTISSVEAFCSPASTAIIPKLLEKKYYEFGTSLNSVASSVMELAGTAVAGVMIGSFGIGTAIMIDAVTFFASAIIQIFIKVEEPVKTDGKTAGAAQYWKELKEGLSYVKSRQAVRNACVLAFLTNAMLVPLNSFQSPLVMDVLKQGSELLSVIGIGSVMGMGIATFAFPYLSKKCSVRVRICGSGIGLGICSAAVTFGSHFTGNTAAVYGITAGSAFGIGFFANMLSCTLHVQFMKTVETEYLARAAALLGAGATAAMPLTSFLLSFLVKYIAVKKIMVTCGVICAIIFIGTWFFHIKMETEETDESKYITG